MALALCSRRVMPIAARVQGPSVPCRVWLPAPAPGQQRRCRQGLQQAAAAAPSGGSGLASKRCEPCEEAKEALDAMGMTLALDRPAAEGLLAQVRPAAADMH